MPFLAYWALDRAGLDITSTAYLLVVAALVFTALAIWVECLAAYRPKQPPLAARGRHPPASAIIAAYLPNEADTIVETVEAFLRQDYNQLQVILAYNTPQDLPVEDELRAIAVRDPRFVPMRVEWSVSKAQNVNAALARVTGTFVGVFDADHHPAPGSFLRAWRWLSNGAGVVQGHCVVRNGEDGSVQKLVATEFEAIYAVAHPGRARVHGFGIFGGSNGYWQTSLLKQNADAVVHAHRGHRLLDARSRRRSADRLRPRPGVDGAGTGRASARSGASACAGRRAGRRCRSAICGRPCATTG